MGPAGLFPVLRIHECCAEGASFMRFAIALILFAGMLHAAFAELPVDVRGTVTMPRLNRPVYVGDVAINHLVDGRMHVIDGESGKYMGMIGTGFAGQFTLSPDSNSIYVATTYLSRLQRGERVDVVEVYGSQDLKFSHEILIAPRRAQGLSYKGYLRTSADGKFLYVLNATPAVSISVIDLSARKQVAEVDAAGCWGIYPALSHPRRFSMLCGDGTVATFTLNEQGQLPDQGGRANSDKLFDPDQDALFVSAEQDRDVYWFVSFTGNVVVIDMGGTQASGKARWSLPKSAQKMAQQKMKPSLAWRPGGYGPLAIDFKRGRLFVAMHDMGKEGSHKMPAQQIWVMDMATQKRIATLPGDASIAMSVPRDAAEEVLYLIDGMKNGLVIRGGPRYGVRHRVTPIGDASVVLDSR
jgi:methylamine dehydrogenase heavy chain